MKHLFFRGLGLLILISFFTISCQNESDKSELPTKDQAFSSDQFKEFFQKVNAQFKIGNALSTRGIIPPQFSSACQPQPPATGLTCATAHIVQTVTLPPNPTCPICTTATVGYDVRVCYVFNGGVPTYSFTFWNFGLAGLAPDCETCIFNLPGHGGDVVLDQMSYQASLIVES